MKEQLVVLLSPQQLIRNQPRPLQCVRELADLQKIHVIVISGVGREAKILHILGDVLQAIELAEVVPVPDADLVPLAAQRMIVVIAAQAVARDANASLAIAGGALVLVQVLLRDDLHINAVNR